MLSDIRMTVCPQELCLERLMVAWGFVNLRSLVQHAIGFQRYKA